MKRRSSRRRRSRLRWFTPNLWNASTPQLYNNGTITPAAPEFTTVTSLTAMVSGSAPFPGVTNAAGRLAGKQLAELQYWQLLRVVGRMKWWLNIEPGDTFTFTQPGTVTVWWSLFRMPTDDQGAPYEESAGTFPVLALPDNQDDKKLILAQDVWRTTIPANTNITGGALIPLDEEPPLYSLIDKTMRRSFRNEQDLFLAIQLGISAAPQSLPNNTTVELLGLLNLRLLGKFGR